MVLLIIAVISFASGVACLYDLTSQLRGMAFLFQKERNSIVAKGILIGILCSMAVVFGLGGFALLGTFAARH